MIFTKNTNIGKYLKILSWANSLTANNNKRSVELEIKATCKIVKILTFNLILI